MIEHLDNAESRWPGRNLLVLVCDDEADTADAIADLVRILGQDAISLTDPEDALEAAATTPDVAILDIRMPKMDGFQCCAAMRLVSPATVFVSCTAWSDQHMARRSAAAGFQYHLTKPIGLQDLETILREVASRG